MNTLSLFRRTSCYTLVAALLLAGVERLPAPISEVESPTPTPAQSAKPKLKSSPRPKPQTKAATEGTTAFDGTWAVTVDFHAYKNPDGTVAKATVRNFVATVKNGVLHGQTGTKGQPNFYELNGTIAADGSANLLANGLTKYSEYTPMNVGPGQPFEYQVTARFKGTTGTGESVGDPKPPHAPRTRIFTFVKE